MIVELITLSDCIVTCITALTLVVMPFMISLLFLLVCTIYGWYKVFWYTAELTSKPVANDNFVLVNKNKIRMEPATIVAEIKVSVSGKISWVDDSKEKIFISGSVIGWLNTWSGLVITARKGRTAPMLIISTNDERIISASSHPYCFCLWRLSCLKNRLKVFI